MLDPNLRSIATAQVACLKRFLDVGPPDLTTLLQRALTPEDVRRAVLKERPLLDQLLRWEPALEDPRVLREEAAAVGMLHVRPNDVAYRRLFPSLELGVYCGSHATGKPSMAWVPALQEHLAMACVHGIGAWEEGWLDAVTLFREAIAELVGDHDGRGDVAGYPNYTEALGAVLYALRGKLVTTAGHFTTAHYVHRAWAQRTGGTVVEVPQEPDETVDIERLVDALDADTTVVSLSHALYRSGFLHDLDALCQAMADRCPDAALLLDAYQTLGTVPVDVAGLPPRAAVLGGGLKQLHSGTGGGFAWISHPLLEQLEPDRTGWWGHRDPLAFDHGPFVPATGADKLRAGTPALAPLVGLWAELRVLASLGGGDLGRAVARARERTRAHMAAGLFVADELGLRVRGGHDPDRRAAFLAIEVGRDDVATALADRGVFVDFRGDASGGVVRVSANAAGFAYEISYALEALAEVL